MTASIQKRTSPLKFSDYLKFIIIYCRWKIQNFTISNLSAEVSPIALGLVSPLLWGRLWDRDKSLAFVLAPCGEQSWKMNGLGRNRIIRIFADQNSVQILSEFRKICQDSWEICKFDESSTSFQIFGEIPKRLHQNRYDFEEILWKITIFCRNLTKIRKSLSTIFAEIFTLEGCEGMWIL